MLRQVTAVVRLNFGSLPTRLGSACVIVVGIAGVTGVLLVGAISVVERRTPD